ncbi:TELO2-interacting protein 2 isoform X2 [Podarcis raffonei]|uniref:TELO2-interacting protein 2 isoform X2 n=1 Tax=Podarcis raffonei TaxID=65483 RepID=UPI002329122E|nr:TELO2-interacting protein 2 isoform X2 [Podarcis raffonei]
MAQHPLLHSLQWTIPEGQGCLERPPAEQVLSQFLQLFASRGASSDAKAGMIRDLLAILEAVDSQWLFGGCHPNATPTLLRDMVVTLSLYAAPPQRQEPEGGGDPSYDVVASRAADVSLGFISIVAKVESAKGLERLGTAVVGPVLRQVAGPLYLFAVTHVAERLWTTPKTRRMAQELLDGLLRASDCRSVPEFLRGAREDETGWLAVVMQCLKPELTKDTWQRSPATKHVFSCTLQHVTRPWLGPHLGKVLPPSLLLSDDYREENKILGVQCLHHIIQNVPAADLCQYNRAQVVYHALFNHLYSKEARLLQVVLLCLLDLLPILEKALQRLPHNPQLVTPSDEVLQLVLTHMESEHRLPLRRVYARNLPAFVERMSCRLAVLLKALLRMMLDVATDRSLTPEPVKAELLQKATECLILLDHASHGQVKVLLEGVGRSCQDETLKECLKKVEEEPVKSIIAP